MILRTTYDGTGGGVAEDRRFYYCQNWRADVSVVLDDAGVQQERVIYSPYGQPFAMPAGDTNFDGDFEAGVDGVQLAGWNADGNPYRAYADVNLDGDIDGDDATAASEHDLGWNVLTSGGVDGVNNRLGYAGYIHDRDVATAAHVRYRVYKIDLGRWVQRDDFGVEDDLTDLGGTGAAASGGLDCDPGLSTGRCLVEEECIDCCFKTELTVTKAFKEYIDALFKYCESLPYSQSLECATRAAECNTSFHAAMQQWLTTCRALCHARTVAWAIMIVIF